MIASQNQNSIEPNAYSAAAVIANVIGEQMLSRLQWMTLNPQVIVDMGCGVGRFAQQLNERFKAATVIGMDWAHPMLNAAKQQANSTIHWIGADTFALPLRDHSVDLIFANLLLPWCHDVKAVLVEWRRVLKPDGLLMFSSLGPDTLSSLRDFVKSYQLPNLTDMHVQGDALIKAKFLEPVLDVEHITLQYRDMLTLVKELQDTAMLSQTFPDDLVEKMQTQLSKEEWQVTYEIVYGQAFAPGVVTEFEADEAGTVRVPVHYLKGLNRS